VRLQTPGIYNDLSLIPNGGLQEVYIETLIDLY